MGGSHPEKPPLIFGGPGVLGSKLPILGMGDLPPLIEIPYNGYIYINLIIGLMTISYNMEIIRV